MGIAHLGGNPPRVARGGDLHFSAFGGEAEGLCSSRLGRLVKGRRDRGRGLSLDTDVSAYFMQRGRYGILVMH
jgi:hypothetical protein